MDFESNRIVQIGNVCIQWANLEYELAVAIWLMICVDNEVGKILTANLDVKQRATMAHAIAHQINAPIPFKRALKQVLEELRADLIHRRNEAVHAVHFTPFGPGVAKVEMHRGKGGRAPRPLKDNDLHALGKQINTLSFMLTTAIGVFAIHQAKLYKVALDDAETSLNILRKISATKSAGDTNGPS
jgi:hypothetical protein